MKVTLVDPRNTEPDRPVIAEIDGRPVLATMICHDGTGLAVIRINERKKPRGDGAGSRYRDIELVGVDGHAGGHPNPGHMPAEARRR